MSRVFSVLEATGAQGKSVIAAVARFNAAHPQNKFKIRGIVRRTDSDVAKQLRAELGDQLEFISANMTNATEIGAALEGTSHLYAITQPFDSDSHGKEYEIGVGISNAAKKAGVKYVWWSSLPDTDEVSGGQASVPHFTDKKRVEVELKKAGLHVISVGPAFYFANWGTYFAPRKLENNVFQWTLPFNADTHVATYAPEDTGLVVGATLENPDDFVGKYIPMTGSNLTVQQYIDIVAKNLGGTAQLVSVPHEQFAKFGFHGADEVARMCHWIQGWGLFGPGADIEYGRRLAPELQRFEDWAAKNKSVFQSR